MMRSPVHRHHLASWLWLGMLMMAALTVSMIASPRPAYAQKTDARMMAALDQNSALYLLRRLGAVQERVARGEEGAIERQHELVLRIAEALSHMPATAWHTPRNRMALVKYALSGGDPAPLRGALGVAAFPENERPLAEGALAYAEGNSALALRHLDKVDVFNLPPSLAGHVALVKAIVVGRGDLARVVKFSDEARLLSPGTLVEETALRLGMEAAIARADGPKFEALASRYFRRFPRSPFLDAMIEPMARAMVQKGYGESPAGVRWIHDVVRHLDPLRLAQFYTALAEIGLPAGKMGTVANAARMVRKYARDGSAEVAWAQAYEGAALVIGPDAAEGLALLNAAEEAGVPNDVREIIAGARTVSHLIRSPPLAKAGTSLSPRVATGAAPAPATDMQGGETLTAVAKVRMRLAEIDTMLKELDQ